MKKTEKDLKDKSIVELKKEADALYQDIAKLQLELKVNPVKDTNNLPKKRKHLAVILTLMNEKKNLEVVKRLVK